LPTLDRTGAGTDPAGIPLILEVFDTSGSECHHKPGPKNRPLGDQAPAVLCADSKPPIQRHLPRRKDSLKNSQYPLCRHSSATPRCIGQTIFRTFALLPDGKHPLLQWCFVYSWFLFFWAAANGKEACHGKLARPVKLFAVRSGDLKNNA
jgi:hypothetical protein